MKSTLLAAVIGITAIAIAVAECPNACSAHGKCGAYDMCQCYRNWMSNDCSERVCQFGLAHVDTPLGDLDSSSGALTDPDTTVIRGDAMYPYGTTEQFPNMIDSDSNPLDNTAHYYRECSNKGICDRSTGDCQCFEGYEGSACQRASCPTSSAGVCSGHGTCDTIKEIAARDFGNVYSLWDEHSTMGCTCDSGYSGYDCSERVCKFGYDPLYYDAEANVRVSNFTIQFYTKTAAGQYWTGNYSLVFYDSQGEDWETKPIAHNANCTDIIDALESIPNDVVPTDSVMCYMDDTPTDNEVTFTDDISIYSRYTIAFTENPGRLKQPKINKYLDGSRATLFTDETTSTLGWHIYPNGFSGEYVDYVNDLCEGITVTLDTAADTPGVTRTYLSLATADDVKTFKKCLGDSNGDVTDNDGVENWDTADIDGGDYLNPHLIKLVDVTSENSGLNVYTQDDDGASNNLNVRNSDNYAYPVTRLCDSTGGDLSVDGSGVVSSGSGWCYNKNPAPFYGVLFYNVTAEKFFLLNDPHADYNTTTKFRVFTTTGWLQLINKNTRVMTHVPNDVTDEVDGAHSTTLYLTNVDDSYSGFFGQVDCETNPTATSDNDALDCLDKDDYFMVLSYEDTIKYPNLYQAKKLVHSDLTNTTNHHLNTYDQMTRHSIVTDYGLNAMYSFDSTATTTNARIYKFNLPSDGGYEYGAECSNRGLCDTATGLCQCFGGYTGDDCGTQNALAV